MPTYLLSQLFGLPAFSAVELSRVVGLIEFKPTLLGSLGTSLAGSVSTTTRSIAVGRTQDKLAVIPASPIGAPPVELEQKPKDLRSFNLFRLAKGSTIYAETLTGILNLPEFEMITTMQGEIAKRLAKIKSDKEFTLERWRLGMVLGRVLDADNSILLDCFDAFGIPEPAFLNLDFDDVDFDITTFAMDLMQDISRNSQGGWLEGQTELYAICGYEVYKRIVTHPRIRETYLNWQAAAALRERIGEQFSFGGITWINYRGSDDGSIIAIAPDEAHFFPIGANDAFQSIMGPAEFEPWIGLPGKDEYVITFPDRDRGAWQRLELYCYPLMLCTRPGMLRKARIGGA